jgi:hypothetical protein
MTIQSAVNYTEIQLITGATYCITDKIDDIILQDPTKIFCT